MKHGIFIFYALVSLGCSGADQFKASKIADSRSLRSLVQSASAGLNMRFTDGGGGGGGGLFRMSAENDVAVECDETVRRRFMSALRTATQKLLGEQGATIHGWETKGSDEDLNGFSWEYSWNDNNGLLLARFYPSTSGKGRLTIFCYEHTRGAAAPPRAKGY